MTKGTCFYAAKLAYTKLNNSRKLLCITKTSNQAVHAIYATNKIVQSIYAAKLGAPVCDLPLAVDSTKLKKNKSQDKLRRAGLGAEGP